MSKYLLSGDIHVRINTIGLSKRVLNTLYDIGKEENREVIILGDIFHTKAIIRSECLNLVIDVMKKKEVKWLLLVGNHDYENSNCDRHSLEALKLLDNVVVIDKLTVLKENNIALLPYCYDSDCFKREVSKLRNIDYLMCHQGISGFMISSFRKDEGDIKDYNVNGFKRVFCGHYHLAQERKNIVYIGSPYQQNFGESDQLNRFIRFDSDTGKREDLALFNFPKHYIYKYSANKLLKEVNELLPLPNKDDHVRFDVFGSKEECRQITKNFIKSRFNLDCDISIKFLYENNCRKVIIKDTLDYISMYKKWLYIQKNSLDKAILLKNGINYLEKNV